MFSSCPRRGLVVSSSGPRCGLVVLRRVGPGPFRATPCRRRRRCAAVSTQNGFAGTALPNTALENSSPGMLRRRFLHRNTYAVVVLSSWQCEFVAGQQKEYDSNLCFGGAAFGRAKRNGCFRRPGSGQQPSKGQPFLAMNWIRNDIILDFCFKAQGSKICTPPKRNCRLRAGSGPPPAPRES